MLGKYVPEIKVTAEDLPSDRNIEQIKVVKYGRVCTLFVNGQVDSAVASWGAVFTLPQKYRPQVPVIMPNSAGLNSYIMIQTTGVVHTASGLSAGGYVQFTATYITSE